MPKPVVARLTTPAQMVASLPHYLGYVPTESLVVVCLHGPRGRIGLTMRYDLPPEHHELDLADDVVRRVRHEAPSRLVLVVLTEEDGDLPRADLVADLVDQLDGELSVTDALLVRDGRYWSYLCVDPRCCPPEGTAVDVARDDTPVRLLEAERVLAGQVVQPDRDALAATLAGPVFLAAAQARQRCEQAWVGLDLDEARGRWDDAVARYAAPPAELAPDEAALLAVSLLDRPLRDELAADFAPAELLPVLAELCRRTPAPYDAPVCTLLAWMTYCDGAGATVTIALDRALASDPAYSLALLLRELLDQQVPPQRLRRLTEEAARELPAATRRARRSRRSRGSAS